MIFFKRTINLCKIATKLFPWSVKPVRMPFGTFVIAQQYPVYATLYFGDMSLKLS